MKDRSDDLRQLELRVHALPITLRGLAREPGGAMQVQERADELLADLDALISCCAQAPDPAMKWFAQAQRAIQLKRRVYGLIYPYLARCGEGSAVLAGLEASARRDLRDSERRLRDTRRRVPPPPPARVPVWCRP